MPTPAGIPLATGTSVVRKAATGYSAASAAPRPTSGVLFPRP